MIDIMTKQELPRPDPIADAMANLLAATKAKERALAAVHRATEAYEKAVEVESNAMEARDEAIRSDSDHTQIAIARITGLSRGRVAQIKTEKPKP
jgi:predicted TPR repeat methyltransferase